MNQHTEATPLAVGELVTTARPFSPPRKKEPPAERTLTDYLFMLKRRWRLVLVCATALFIAATIVILLLPATYRADVLVLLQAPTVSTGGGGGSVIVPADISKKLDVLREQVESRRTLSQVIKKFDLYAASRGLVAPDAIYEEMRKSITLKMGKSSFNLFFDHPDTQTAADVANELARQYIEENTRLRRQSLENTSAFLNTQIKRLERDVKDMEQALQEFRRQNMGMMPEDVPANQALLLALSAKVSQSEANIDSERLRKRKAEDRVTELLNNEIMARQREIKRLNNALARFPSLDDGFEPPPRNEASKAIEVSADAAVVVPDQEVERNRLADRLLEIETALARQKPAPAGAPAADAGGVAAPEVARLKAEQAEIKDQLDQLAAAQKPARSHLPNLEARSTSTGGEDDLEMEILREKLRDREASVGDAERNVEDLENLLKRGMVSEIIVKKARNDLGRVRGDLRIQRVTALRTRSEMVEQLKNNQAEAASMKSFQTYWTDLLVKIQEIEAQRLRITGQASEAQVRSATTRIEALTAELATLRTRQSETFEKVLSGRGELATQVQEHENILSSIVRQQRDTQDDKLRIADLERRLINSAKVQVQLPELLRKHHTMTDQYEAMLRHKMESDMAMGVEDQQEGERMVIWDPAIVTSTPYKPKYALLFGGSAVLALGAAAALALLLELMAPKFLTLDSLQTLTGADVLAAIDHLPRKEVPTSLPVGMPASAASIVALSDPWHHLSKQFMDAACLLFKPHEKWPRVVAVCSPGKGDGKTFVAANLAAALAIGSRHTTLLVDANLRAPSLNTLFSRPLQPGLAEALENGPIHVNPIVGSLPCDLQLLTAGAAQRHGPVLLGSSRFREIMEKLTYQGTRPRIILDTPPLHAGADVDVLLDGVDGVLLVVRRGHTAIADVERALRRIRPDKLIGIIFNARVAA